MKVKLFAVLDSASGVYDGPVPAQSELVAMRNFSDLAKNPESVVGKHPADFSLWYVGVWNDATGEIELEETGKKCLAYAMDILTPNEEN